MKRLLPVLLILAAVPRAEAADRIYHDLLDADVASKKTAVMERVLPLTGEDAAAFTGILAEYEKERVRLADLRNELVQEYAAVEATMSEQVAEVMVKQFLDLESKEMDLKKRTLRKVQEKLSARAASKFYLADTKLDLIAYLQILARLPFVK